MSGSLVLRGIGELVTNASDRPGDLGIVEDAAVAVVDGRVAYAGPDAELPAEYADLPGIDVDGRAVIPGFVDAHTHAVFAGDRADEFARRLRGDTYEEILAAGGGILSTVTATREAGFEGLWEVAEPRLGRMAWSGSTTIEVKSGYGLDPESERTLLEVAAVLDRAQPYTVVTT
ncbi:MAG TPA: imidazolonepropionase, partial [Actinobacteria bacterium]|nr:imidazolonepropionase [Actinomycetota bacterium]